MSGQGSAANGKKLCILLPPSEGKREGGTGAPLAQVHPITQALISEIAQANPAALYATRRAEAEAINAQILTSQTLPAIERYDGVVYTHLDLHAMPTAAQAYVRTHVQIVSALFGVISATEPIPNYVLSISKLGAAKRWFVENTARVQNTIVIDLLPDTHRAAVSYNDGVKIDFTYERNGKIVRAGHEGKRIKGLFVRWLALNSVQSVEHALTFAEDGYAWNGNVFHRKSK